jgi:hypothetical protein
LLDNGTVNTQHQKTSGGHKKNTNNNTTPIFIGLNKTTQTTQRPQKESSERKDKE